jgi:glycosyltransferase involved in cell wall biosynthesis
MPAADVTLVVSALAGQVDEVPEVRQALGTESLAGERSIVEPDSGFRVPRVLILVENNSVPADPRVWNIATALVRADCEVVVVCPEGGEDARSPSELRDGVRIYRYPLRPSTGGLGSYLREYGSALWRTWRLVARLSGERPFDVVHACNPPDFLLFAAWPARRAGARIILDHHDLTPELLISRFGSRLRWLHRLALILERVCYAAADVVMATNESYSRVARTRGHKRPEDVFVVRNGPDLRRFRPAIPDPSLRRGKPLLIGYMGVMAPQDGVDHALRALALLGERRQDWHAIFAGAGDALPQLQQLSAELGLQDRVEFIGWLEKRQIPRMLCSCDVCLSPEPHSPLNDVSSMVKIAEYMAMSRPIVAYGLRESRFAAGEAAIYAEPNDVASFAARIDELLDDPARRAAMGRTGRERIELELSWEHSEHNLIVAYRRALGDWAAR